MRTIDTHFHWYPRSAVEQLFDDSNAGMRMSDIWFDLARGLDNEQSVVGDCTVIATSGVVTGLIDRLPLADAVALAHKYNEGLAEAQRAHPGQFYGTGIVPLLSAEEAILVADSCVKEFGLVGINLPPLIPSLGQTFEKLDGFFERIVELDVPLIIHPTDLIFGDLLCDYDHSLQLTVGRLFDTTVNVLRLIFEGVFDRHPDLRVVQTHAGGFLPYQAGRIDKNFRVPELQQQPSNYLKNIFVDTVAPQPLTIETAVKFYGEDRVLFGTDYPCWTPANAIEVIRGADLGPHVAEKILTDNAHKVFRLK